MPALPAFISLLSDFLISLLFFGVLGAICFAFLPNRKEALHHQLTKAPGKAVLRGLIGLSILFGLVPITALTIIGLPFVPIAFLRIIVVWIIDYALGAYSVIKRLWLGFGGDRDLTSPSLCRRRDCLCFAAVVPSESHRV